MINQRSEHLHTLLFSVNLDWQNVNFSWLKTSFRIKSIHLYETHTHNWLLVYESSLLSKESWPSCIPTSSNAWCSPRRYSCHGPHSKEDGRTQWFNLDHRLYSTSNRMQLDNAFCSVPRHGSWELHFRILVPQAALRLSDKHSCIVSLLLVTTHLLTHSQIRSFSPHPYLINHDPQQQFSAFSPAMALAHPSCLPA